MPGHAMGSTFLTLALTTGLENADPTGLDTLGEVLTNPRVVGLMGLCAVLIGVIVSTLKRWNATFEGAPNWWMRLSVFRRTLVVTLLGVAAGAIASLDGGATPAQAGLIGLSGVLSALGHAVAQKVGLAGPFASDPSRNPLVELPPRNE